MTNASPDNASSWIATAVAGGQGAAGGVLVLSRDDVLRCVTEIDVVDVVRTTLAEHDRGHCVLPSEAYLPWRNAEGAYSRSIAMPGAVVPACGPPRYGMKIINASVSNPAIGLERAGGIGLCFDSQTARITTIMEVGVLSALRTAAVSAAGVEVAGYDRAGAVSVIGCGMQGRVHVFLLLERLAKLGRISLFDQNEPAARRLADQVARARPDVEVVVLSSARQAVAAGDIVITTTTVSEGYVEPDWIAQDALVVNVSLADLTDEALLGAGALYVDDVELIAENPRRPLGRLLRENRLGVPGQQDGPRKRIDATIGGLITGRYQPVTTAGGYAVLNPFGMSVLDVAVLDAVRCQAVSAGLGTELWLG
ncbi:MAG: ornithine cyclodeaminase [Kibdelosporangium sp.]